MAKAKQWIVTSLFSPQLQQAYSDAVRSAFATPNVMSVVMGMAATALARYPAMVQSDVAAVQLAVLLLRNLLLLPP